MDARTSSDPGRVPRAAGEHGAAAGPDFRALFEAAPGLYLVLRADAPRFTVEAASDAYLRATLTTRDGPGGIVGRGIFEAFPDPPGDPTATGTREVRASLERALATGAPDAMPVQPYAIRRPDGAWEDRAWLPLHTPVRDPATGRVTHVIQRVEDVTEARRLAAERDRLRGAHAESERQRLGGEDANAALVRERAALERANELLQDQAARFEFQAEELRATAAQLEERTEEAEALAARLRASEAHGRAVFAHAAVGMGRVGFADARWLDVNDAFCRMLGYAREELLATPWPAITHPEDVELDLVPFRRMAAGELAAYAVEKRFVHKRGHHVWARLTLSLVRDAAGRPDYEVAVIEDVTARKDAEAERARLLEAERAARHAAEVEREQLARLVDALPVMVTVYDPALAETPTGAVRLNRAFVEALGWSEDDARGGDLMARCYPDAAVRAAAAAHMSHPGGGWCEIPTRAADGRTVPVLWGNVRLAGDRQVGVGVDLTARHAAERALAERDARYRALFESVDVGFCVLEMLFDERGAAVDYRFLEANPAFVVHTGLADAAGRTARELVPNLEPHWFETYGRVATTGEPIRFEMGSAAMGRWFDVHATRVGRPEERRVALIFSDVSAARAAGRERDALLAAEQRSRSAAESAAAALGRERATLAAVIESLPVGVGVGTPDGRVLSMNRAGLALHGFASEAEMVARLQDYAREFELRYPDGRVMPVDEWPMSRAMRGEYVRGYELRLRHQASGRERVVSYDVVPVRDGGPAALLVYLIHDLTEARRAAAVLLERTAVAERREAELSAVLERLPAAVWIADAAGRIERVSAATAQLYGAAPLLAETEEYGVYEAYWPAGHPKAGARLESHEWALARALATGVTVPGEPLEIARFGSGERRQVLNAAAAVRDAAGRIAGAVAVMFDVTEQEEARRALEAARAEAERANAAKSQFLATMSHELRTPLNAIGGHVQLVQMGLHGAVTDAQREALGRVDRAQRHLLGLINDILNYARLEAARVEYDVQAVPVADVARDVLPLVEPQFAAKQLALHVDLPGGQPGGEPVRVWADREKLAQVLLNLLSNAAKFTAPGGRVSVRLEEPGAGAGPPDAALLRVADTGVGIPADKLERVFEPFVQVHAGLTREHQGTGLGLAISRDLARGMGGDLWVESEVGAGSTFTIALRATTTAGGEPTDRRSRAVHRPFEEPRRANEREPAGLPRPR